MNTNFRKISFLLILLFIIAQLIIGKFFIAETTVVVLFLIITNLPKNFAFSGQNLFIPQNFAFGIFFLRFYIIPLTGIIWGYHHEVPLPAYSDDRIFSSYLLELLAYFAFLVGWETHYYTVRVSQVKVYTLSNTVIKKLIVVFLALGLIPLFFLFDTFIEYLLQIFIFNNIPVDFGEHGKWGTLLLIYSRFFLPFSVICFSSLIDFKKVGTIKANLILVGLVITTIIFSLSSNRQSMVYPILGLLGGVSVKALKFKILPVVLTACICIYGLIIFKELRGIDVLNPKLELINNQGIVTSLQVYGTGPLNIVPSFDIEVKRNSILPSFFSSVPLLGKPLRERSGVSAYNLAIYKFHGVAEDQVFPTIGEAYVNGGLLLVLVFFLITGFFYAKLNRYFINCYESDILYRSSVFYLALLFNSTILLSFQVMGQFLFYNSIPAFIVIIAYHINKLQIR